MKAIANFGFIAALLAGPAQSAWATDATWEYAVRVTAAVSSSPPRITLSWPQDTLGTPNSYTLYRKDPQATSWGTGLALPGATTSYVDASVSPGTTYEYQIVKDRSTYTGYGYIQTGIDVPLTEHRGTLVLVVDDTYAASLSGELARLQQDLVGDGWTVLRHEVARADSPAHVKALIQADYNADPAGVQAVFLFGHVPVPYSGNLAPDGHDPDHYGAWPADVYYGDMTGTWTDSSVNNTEAADPRNRNVPGDGKFDQSFPPGKVVLEIGRVDLSNLPGELIWDGPSTLPSELDLLRQYLNKDHAFRNRLVNPPARALVADEFGSFDGQAFAASAYRSLAPLLGPDNVATLTTLGTWIPTLQANAYLWAFGGGAGSYNSIGGLGPNGAYDTAYSTDIVGTDSHVVFAMLFGSWFGDWDSQDNVMRAVLATPTYGLASAWSGRPHWFFHPMGLGETIGYCARLTQNNGPDGLYQNQVNEAAGQVHIALMGDPTLRMYPVAPPSAVQATPVAGGIQLAWTASPDPVLGYHVYRADTAQGPFTRLTSALVTSPAYIDLAAGSGRYTYMVRAVKLETTPSGTFFNASQGTFAEANGTSAPTPSPQPIPTTTRLGGDETIWLNGALPAGAVPRADGGDAWRWINHDPTPLSGALAHASTLTAGLHQHYFFNAAQTLLVNPGDTLFAYVFLDPQHPPTEVMLQWNDGTWAHRAYWGAPEITFGADGTASSRRLGPVPPAGRWVLLTVPAGLVGLEGHALNGMAFSLYDGQATWDCAGKF